MTPEQAVDGDFDLLIIDDICSFMTTRLVVDLRRVGKGVLGVFAPSDSADAKRRLLEAGVSDVIESDATPSEFLDQIVAVAASGGVSAHVPGPHGDGFCLVITGPPGGVGVTEVAIGLATQVRGARVALIDLNQSWPSIAPRLGLPVHPNLRTAVDLVLHEPDRLAQSFHQMAGGLSVVTGLVNPESGPLPAGEVASLISELAVLHDLVIVDAGPPSEWESANLARAAQATLVVGVGDPIGITRLIRVSARVASAVGDREVAVVVNRSKSPRQQAQAVLQINRTLPKVPVFVAPEDPGLARARWDGLPAGRGPFARSTRRLAGLFQELVAR